jgi:hypothetical protein
MPLLLTCQDLQVGMRLAEGFVFRGRTMLPGGKTLTSDDVDILCRKYPDVTLKVGDPILDSLVAFEDDTRDREVAGTVTQQIQSTMTDVQKKFGHHTDLSGVDFNRIRSTVSSVVDFLKGNPVSAALINRSVSGQGYLAEHAGNVFYLSMVLGAAVRDYVVRERQRQTSASNLTASVAMDLLPLGLGAMFLDVAMAPLEHVFAPDYELSAEDRKAIFEHPTTGADMLPDTIPAATKMIVRWHHENFDGSGYPHKRPGPSLHVFVRIARICDAFDAATSVKFYQRPKSPVRALWEMSAGPYRKYYDPVLMKVFLSIIQPFPIGARVTLQDGRGAVVVKYNRRSPFFPTVVVAYDEKGQRLTKEQMIGPVNVGEGNDLRLKSFGAEDLSYLHDTAEIQMERSEGSDFKDLLETAYP